MVIFRGILHVLWDFSLEIFGLFEVFFQYKDRSVYARILKSKDIGLGRDLNSIVISYKSADRSLMLYKRDFKVISKVFSSTNNNMLINFVTGNSFAISPSDSIVGAYKCVLDKFNHESIKVFLSELVIGSNLDSDLFTFVGNIPSISKQCTLKPCVNSYGSLIETETGFW